jgi:hypothetical protein
MIVHSQLIFLSVQRRTAHDDLSIEELKRWDLEKALLHDPGTDFGKDRSMAAASCL